MPRYRLMSLTVLVFAMVIGVASPTLAQRDAITYDEVIRGTLTSAEETHLYNLRSQEGEVLIFTVKAVDPWGSLRFPKVRILDVYMNPIFTSENHTGHFGRVTHEVILAARMPLDATVLIEVSAEVHSQVYHQTPGDYELIVQTAIPLVLDDDIQSTLLSNGEYHYYLVEQPRSFEVAYLVLEGYYRPQLRVNTITEDNELHTIAYTGGDTMLRSTIGAFAEGQPYIISLGPVIPPMLTDELYFVPEFVRYQISVSL